MTLTRSLLLVGDLLALVAFAVIGRRSHEEAVGIEAALAIATTAAPFVGGWIVASTVQRLRAPLPYDARGLLLEALRMWLVAYPLAVIVRALILGRLSPASFYVVAFCSALAMLLVWRLVIATATLPRRATT